MGKRSEETKEEAGSVSEEEAAEKAAAIMSDVPSLSVSMRSSHGSAGYYSLGVAVRGR